MNVESCFDGIDIPDYNKIVESVGIAGLTPQTLVKYRDLQIRQDLANEGTGFNYHERLPNGLAVFDLQNFIHMLTPEVDDDGKIVPGLLRDPTCQYFVSERFKSGYFDGEPQHVQEGLAALLFAGDDFGHVFHQIVENECFARFESLRQVIIP